jgi:hypothetical protein
MMAATVDTLELNGLRPGVAKSAIHQQMPGLKCAPESKVREYSECTYVRTNPHQEVVNALKHLGGEPVESWEFRFDDGILGRIMVSLDSQAFDKVVSALRAKFGEPNGKASETLYNRAGTPVISRQFTWGRNGHTMVATEFAGRMGRSVVSLASDAHLNRARA